MYYILWVNGGKPAATGKMINNKNALFRCQPIIGTIGHYYGF